GPCGSDERGQPFCERSDDRMAAVWGAFGSCAVADGLQVRQAAWVFARPVLLVHEAPDLLRRFSRPPPSEQLLEKGAGVMPLTFEQREKQLDNPALCEQLPVRDYLDNVMVRTSGTLVAGYELRGITSYFGSDEERDRGKVMLGALLKSIPEQSMRVQLRYEVFEDLGNLLEIYASDNRSGNENGQMLDAARLEAWRQKAEAGH